LTPSRACSIDCGAAFVPVIAASNGFALGLASRLDLIAAAMVALLSLTWDFLDSMRVGDAIRAETILKGKRSVMSSDQGLVESAIKLLNRSGVTARVGDGPVANAAGAAGERNLGLTK
jgi:hypothetical protein